MKKIERFKIKRMRKMSTGIMPDYYRFENFKCDKKEFYKADIGDLLQNDKVYPFYIDLENNYLLFVEVDLKIDHNSAPFFYEPLQSKAKYLFRIDIADFNLYMEKYDTHLPEEKTLFIHHPGRCGSTLLHKILGSHPQIESFSEDLIFNNLFLEKNTKSPNFEEFGKTFLSYLHKKYNNANEKYLSLKMTGTSRMYIEKLLALYPTAKHIYITRNPITISESFINLLMGEKVLRFLKWFGYFSFKHKVQWEDGNHKSYKPYGFKLDKFISFGVVDEKIKGVTSGDLEELTVFRVLLTDKLFDYYSQRNLIKIDYNELTQKDYIFDKLSKYLGVKNNFDESIYNKHSQSDSIAAVSITKRYKQSEDRRNKLESYRKHVTQLLGSSPN